jgi:hypothetical protein
VRENLCRAFSIGRTTKSFFAVRFRQDARQTENAREKIVCRVFFRDARQTFFPNFRHLVASEGEPLAPREGQIIFFSLPCVKIKTHGKDTSLPCVFILAHDKVFSSIYVT